MSLSRKLAEQLTSLLTCISDGISEHPTNKKQRKANAQLTSLKDLVDAIFENHAPITSFKDEIEALFVSRWEAIKNHPSQRYDITPSNPVNQCYITFANICAQYMLPQQYPRISFYQLLFPSLTLIEDIFGQSIGDFTLNEIIIVGEQHEAFLSIKDCLSFAIHEENIGYQLYHTSFVSDTDCERMPLNTFERKLLSSKSQVLSGIMDKLKHLTNLFDNELILLNELNNLYNGLKHGDVNHLGSEHESGTVANVAVVNFSHFYECLSLSEQERLGSFELEDETAACDNFAELWELIQHPVYESENGMVTVSCLALLGDVLAQLIHNNLSQLIPEKTQRYSDKLSRTIYDYLDELNSLAPWLSDMQHTLQQLPKVAIHSDREASIPSLSDITSGFHTGASEQKSHPPESEQESETKHL